MKQRTFSFLPYQERRSPLRLQPTDRFTLRSLLHKAMRTGDVDLALAATDRSVEGKSEASLKKYVAAVLLEETRSTDLLFRFQSLRGMSAHEMVASVTKIRKKWETGCREGVFLTKCRAYLRARDMPEITTHDVEHAVREAETLDALYLPFWRVVIHEWETGPRWEALTNALRQRAREIGGVAEQVAMEVRQAKFYVLCLLIEMIAGHWSGECNATLPEFSWPERKTTRDGLIAIPRWTFDCHTHRKKLVVANLMKIRPGHPMPQGLDLRWTGQLLGVLWRRKAFEQFGDTYRFRAWEDVLIGKSEWDLTIAADKFWYARLWRKAAELSQEG